ncbi:AP-4 complex subunit beta-1-like isoform X2 [Macrobrachium nipponense]|uniref:AP-4 complex subunit beta-1-like isoform X2 n=1 Tax=Macrobrachium nipponense TaxID=159736 RepID=UPI0030C86E4F
MTSTLVVRLSDASDWRLTSDSPSLTSLGHEITGDVDLPTSEVVELLASHTTLAKKLTCSHIANKCTSNTDLALLTANLLLKDAGDANPSVRSASILALAALPGIEESTVRALTAALSDQAAQVRRAAAVACSRFFTHTPNVVLECGLVDALYDSLRDSDPIVISNAIISLDTILKNEGGMVINKNIAHYLLGRILQFSDCNAVYILTLLLRYCPKTDEEIFLLLNALDELLSSKAPAVLVGCIKLFLHWTENHSHLKKDMLEIIQTPICKILSRNVPETAFLILGFLRTLGDIREVFGPHFKYFLVRAKDPGYLKTQKLKVLPLVSTKTNVCSLIEEVKPFCSDYQSFREAVSCVSALAQVSASAYKQCLNIFIMLLDSPTERVVIATLECLMSLLSSPVCKNELCSTNTETSNPSPVFPEEKDIDGIENESSKQDDNGDIKKDALAVPDIPQDLISALTRALSRCSVQEAAPSLVLYILGTMSAFLNCSPDILESMSSLSSVSNFSNADLVTAAARIFLSRPAQMHLILASVLSNAFAIGGASANRAALVYAALLEGPKSAASLLGANDFLVLENLSVQDG